VGNASRASSSSGTAELAVERRGTTLEVVVRGDLRSQSVADFEHTVARALGDCDERVVLDLHDLAFVDAAGIRALLDARSHASARRRDLVLVDVKDEVRDALTDADSRLVVASEISP